MYSVTVSVLLDSTDYRCECVLCCLLSAGLSTSQLLHSILLSASPSTKVEITGNKNMLCSAVALGEKRDVKSGFLSSVQLSESSF